MKTISRCGARVQAGSTSDEAGSVLIATLLLATVIGFSLASYLTLVSNQNQSVMRSLSWNRSIAVIEGGLEEALTHLHDNGASHLERDSWSQVSSVSIAGTNLVGSYYTKTRWFGRDYVNLVISGTTPPAIYAQGFVLAPMSTNRYVTRAVRITTTNNAMFAKGMVARGSIDLNGNNVLSDSFDSGDPLYSTAGRYDPAKVKDSGDMASNSGIVGIVSVGNANVYGKASTGPGGSVTVGAQGGVGSHAWQAGNKGIQPGWSSDDMNVQFPDVALPFSGGYSTPGGNPLKLTASGNWQVTGDLTKSLVVNSNVNAVLLITGNVLLTGNDSITISPGGTLKMYVQGASAKIAGNGVVNQAGSATNFIYYGLPSNTSLDFSGNGTFTGAIYAPNAAFTLGGGGNSTQDFIGSSVTSTAKLNGHFNFHYDELLGRLGPQSGFVITSWNEM